MKALKKIFLKTLVFLIFLTYSANANVIIGFPKVVDGDTLRINGEKVRLFGIDAPEINQNCYKNIFSFNFLSYSKKYKCGKKSANKLSLLVKNSRIVCQIRGIDRYQRKIAICFKGNLDINAWLIKEGLAVAYKKYSRKYSYLEKQAKDNQKGIWGGNFDMPWNWRKKNK